MPDAGIFSGPAAAAALGLIGGGAAAASGVGNNGYRAGSFDQSKSYNPNAFNYGGTPGGANAAAQAYGINSSGAQQRQQLTLDPSQMDQSRGSELDALGMQRSAAMGLQPSVAQLQMQGAMEDNARMQQSQAASARGPAAMAMAQYGAAANTASANQGLAFNSSMLRAGEMANARNAYMQGAGGIRAGDYAAANANLNAGIQNRGQNDQASLGWAGLANNVQQSQLQAQGNQQQMLANSMGQANGLNAGINSANAANGWKQYGAIMGGMQGAAGGAGLQGGGGGAGGAAGGAGGAGGGAAGGGAGAAIPPVP